MNEEVMKAIIAMLGQGGVEAAEVARLYLWLYSPVVKGLFFWGGIILLYWGASRIARRLVERHDD